MKNQSQGANKLIYEKSPYLLQHATNPVEWYPWGAEAFARAKAEDKPIFLSIGYSTCHWCHVMAHESFENSEVARLLNQDFICIKVDREERPDIDTVYMAVCLAMTGAGGWPLTVVMTPEQQPFYAATYLPRESGPMGAGLLDLLPEIARQWRENKGRLQEAGARIAAFVRETEEAPPPPGEPGMHLADDAFETLQRGFDGRRGGFGPAPKFPVPHNLLFLMRYGEQKQGKAAMAMVEKTLEQMARGGIQDHIGGGFSRYSTDAQWLAPHFEKMLYDNALLAYTYAEAFRRTGRPLYREVCRRTIGYVLRELWDPAGGFYCGQDADSEGVEGKYYLFSPEEITRALGPEEAEGFCRRYDITPKGNFEGGSIPNLLRAEDWEQEPAKSQQNTRILLEYRRHRCPLHRDDKVLTAWNGLMIAALARAAQVLEEPPYLRAARQARDFIRGHLTDATGNLHVRWRQGEAGGRGQLDDFAFYAWGLLELYQAGRDAADLAEAVEVARRMVEQFWDGEAGGFFLTAKDGEQLIHRPKPVHDGAMPAGNSVAALVLGRLWQLTGQEEWRGLAQAQQRFLAGHGAASRSMALLAMLEWLEPPAALVVAQTGPWPQGLDALLAGVGDKVRTLVKDQRNTRELAELAPFTADYPLPKEGCTFYLCRNGACLAPVSTLAELEALLAQL